MQVNRTGAVDGLTPGEVKELQEKDGKVLDLRAMPHFHAGHLPGSVNIPFMRSGLGRVAASVLEGSGPLVLVADNAVIAQVAAADLERSGFRVAGYLDGGIQAWKQAGLETTQIPDWDVTQLQERLERGDVTVLDVREPYEYQSGHVEGAELVPLNQLERRARELDPEREYAVICATGSRSLVAANYLYRMGFTKVANVAGGMSAWVQRRLPVAY